MLVFLSVTRLQLLVALVAGLTGTWWGFGLAAAVLGAIAVHARTRRSSATGAGVLSALHRADPLDPSRDARQPAAQA